MIRLKPFTTENLAILDEGKVREAMDYHIAKLIKDCTDRPGESKTRSVKMEIVFAPVADDKARLISVKTQIKIASAVPKHQTRVMDLGVTNGGTLVFNPDSLDNVDQTVLFDDEDDA